MRVTNSNTIVGPNDCPNGEKAVSYSNSGRCPENMDSKSIWVKKGQETFAKDTKITVSECGCNLEGALDNKCNYKYGCTCKRGYTGRKCDQCETGFDHPTIRDYKKIVLNISKNKCLECSQNCNLCDSCRTTQKWYVPNSGQCSTNNCAYNGENYRWCYIENAGSTWDYCERQEERYTCCGRDTDKERQLWNAAGYGRLDEVRQLLQTTYVDPYPYIHLKNDKHVINAVEEGNIDISFGLTTPLLQAAKNGHTDIVQILLDNGANIDFQLGELGEPTALILAAIKGHKDVVELLLKRGANTKLTMGFTIEGQSILIPRIKIWNRNACYWNERVDNIISC